MTNLIESTMSPDLTRPLNLPPVTLDIRPTDKAGSWDVYDSIRSKWVALTPEERVRQTFVRYLVSRGGFSANRVANEVGLVFNRTKRRADSVIYDDYLRPYVIVEYKAPSVDMTPKVIEQALRYNMVFRAPFIVVTNGLKTFTFYVTKLSGDDLGIVCNLPTASQLAAFLVQKSK